jgi:Outer membrane protein beta-barrel domain
VSISRKLAPVLAFLAVSASPALAQDWGVGASIGLVNDVEHRIRLDHFDPRDVNAWVDFALEERVLLRGTMGSIKTKGSKAGLVADIDGDEVVLPDLKERIDYVDVAISYQFWEGDFTSGLFGGIGGYKIDPDRVDPEFRGFEDPKETVFGFHAGLDGDLRVISHLSIVGRITFHKIFSDTNRSLLTANVGAAFRF